MKYLRWILLAALVALLAAAIWWALKPSAPPEIDIAAVERGRLVSELATNGKTEPAHWIPVQAAREGRVVEVSVELGKPVTEGQPLARLAAPEADAELAAARARVERARAALAPVEQGGRRAELAELDGTIARLRAERESALRDEQSLERLLEKNAATRTERDAARDRRVRLDFEIRSSEAKRAALVEPAERASAKAALDEAQRQLAAVEARLEDAIIRAPRSGIVYDLSIRAGDWLGRGAPVARIGSLEQLRVTVYVDEPELGGLALRQPVTVTWDALPRKEWRGAVERLPRQIVSLGSRQVGEVVSIVENPALELPAGANVNARIVLQTIENAISIPKEALRREGDKYGVFVVNGDRVHWRAVETGATSVTRIEIRSGLREGERIALAGEETLRDGMNVRVAAAVR